MSLPAPLLLITPALSVCLLLFLLLIMRVFQVVWLDSLICCHLRIYSYHSRRERARPGAPTGNSRWLGVQLPRIIALLTSPHICTYLGCL